MMCLKGQHWSAWSKLHLEHIIQIPAVFIKKAQGSLDELEVTILNHKIINNEWIKKKKKTISMMTIMNILRLAHSYFSLVKYF